MPCSKIFADTIFRGLQHARKYIPRCNLSSRIYGDLGVLNVRRERHGSDLPVQFQRQRLSRGLSNSLENLLTAAAFPFSLAYLPICARCLSVSRPYDPRARVFALASRFSTDKTSRFACRIVGGGISAESGPAGSGRWPLTGLKQRSSAIVQ